LFVCCVFGRFLIRKIQKHHKKLPKKSSRSSEKALTYPTPPPPPFFFCRPATLLGHNPHPTCSCGCGYVELRTDRALCIAPLPIILCVCYGDMVGLRAPARFALVRVIGNLPC
jgi:hypothetical protein